MGRMYTVEFENEAFTNALGNYDAFEILPAADTPIRIHAIIIENVSEVGDAEEEMVRWQIVRGNTVSGNGSATTPARLRNTDPVAVTSAETVASTPAGAGSPVDIHSGAFNIRVGLIWIPTPEMRPYCDNGEVRICVRLPGTFADDVVLSGTLYFEEL